MLWASSLVTARAEAAAARKERRFMVGGRVAWVIGGYEKRSRWNHPDLLTMKSML
jgi:hypothetical protein